MGLGQSKHARLGVAGLAQRRDGTHLDKAKPHRCQAVNAAGVFVQSGGHADAVGKVQACQRDRVVHPALAVSQRQRRALGVCQGCHGEVVSGFGIQAKQKTAGQRVREQGHLIIKQSSGVY